jgi:hypothetical protein
VAIVDVFWYFSFHNSFTFKNLIKGHRIAARLMSLLGEIGISLTFILNQSKSGEPTLGFGFQKGGSDDEKKLACREITHGDF